MGSIVWDELKETHLAFIAGFIIFNCYRESCQLLIIKIPNYNTQYLGKMAIINCCGFSSTLSKGEFTI